MRLIDGTTVTVREPEWCAGEHENGKALADLCHDGPESALRVQFEGWPIDLLHVALTQHPYALAEAERRTVATMDLGDGPYPFDSAGLRMLAAELAVYAGRLRDLARQLAAVEAREVGR
ncbi:hypothetical protein [Kitasatospora sp. NPDC051914]|uniref:DUF6907 domain-containing protein n=1 Tax=Kitasatospora sp. NPDC051914 TaxID=3154945 RepID=UPI003417D36E